MYTFLHTRKRAHKRAAVFQGPKRAQCHIQKSLPTAERRADLGRSVVILSTETQSRNRSSQLSFRVLHTFLGILPPLYYLSHPLLAQPDQLKRSSINSCHFFGNKTSQRCKFIWRTDPKPTKSTHVCTKRLLFYGRKHSLR